MEKKDISKDYSYSTGPREKILFIHIDVYVWNGYRCRKCIRRYKFWTRLIAVHITLIPFRKV